WTGFMQNSVLGLSSDAVRLTVDPAAAAGAGQVHIAYGSAAPPPPATVATDPYPPGHRDLLSSMLIEGFVYLGHNVSWEAVGQQWRLRFMIDQYEPWGSWCRLQSSYVSQQSGTNYYSCVPNASGYSIGPGGGDAGPCALFDPAGGPSVPWSCAQIEL